MCLNEEITGNGAATALGLQGRCCRFMGRRRLAGPRSNPGVRRRRRCTSNQVGKVCSKGEIKCTQELLNAKLTGKAEDIIPADGSDVFRETEPQSAVLPASKELPPFEKDMDKVSERVRKIVDAALPTCLNITVNRICGEINFGPSNDPKVLETVVTTIFMMARADVIDDIPDDASKHARRGETFADLLFALRSAVPEFHIVGDDKPMTLTRILLNVMQDTFEQMANEFQDAGKRMSREDMDSLIAVVSFIGHLYVRDLIAIGVVARVVHDLIGVRDVQPHENFIRSTCELMHVVCRKTDRNKQGNMLVTQFLARLSNLIALKKPGSDEPMYPKGVKDAIMGVHEARFNRWPERAGTLVLVQFHIVDRDEAQKLFSELYRKNALSHSVTSEDAMDLPHNPLRPKEMEDEQLKHIKVTSFISGNALAVMFSRDLQGVTASALQKAISAETCIHHERTLLFGPDSKLLKNDDLVLNGCH